MVSILRYRADGERAHTIGGLAPPVTDADVDGWIAPALRGAGWVVIGTQHGGDVTPDALAALAHGDRRLVLDAQGPLREPRLGPLRLRSELDPALLAHVQVLKLSEEEAQAAYGTLDAREIARLSGVAEVLVTLGVDGARVWSAGEGTNVAAVPVSGADPTGAGDSFLALYARARAAGAGPVDATERACADVAAWLATRA
jgi:sugar/nucleoside kinase (ribokinase family)